MPTMRKKSTMPPRCPVCLCSGEVVRARKGKKRGQWHLKRSPCPRRCDWTPGEIVYKEKAS